MNTRRFLTLALAVVCLAASVFAQNPATWGTYAGRYGLSSWAINNQRVASQYNYYVDSSFQTAVGALFTFNVTACTLNMAGNKNIVPFNSNATVKIVDINSANTETVNGATPSLQVGNGTCFLPLAPVNQHFNGSYILRSGTCGLKEAQNDKGTNPGTIIVDQKFYDDGCLATTITSLVGGVAGDYVVDISNGQYNQYGWNGTAMKLISQQSNSHFGFGNTDIIGTLTLSGGAGTLTFAKPFTVAPICVGTDTTATNAVKISTTTTAATFAGTTTDVIAYQCFGNPN